jgi:quercetin dioxygenase-like cupin family protein
MFDRLLDARADPGWRGWVVLVGGEALLVLSYVAATRRRPLRPGIASGLVYGVVVWLLVGAGLMPLMALVEGPPAPGVAPNDPMQASFMMLHLGVLAPLSALIALAMFGAILGATSVASYPSRGSMQPIALLAAAVVVGAAMVLVATSWSGARETNAASEPITEGRIAALPPGQVFASIIELRQPAGATLGPHEHVAGFVYTLGGLARMPVADGSVLSLGPGQAGFVGTNVRHAHDNPDNRVPAAALGLGLIAATVLLCAAVARQPRPAAGLVVVLSLAVAAGGVLGIWNPFMNDWYFIGVRPETARGAPMPVPTATRTYESPNLVVAGAGPYVERLRVLSLPPGGQAVAQTDAGPDVLLVLSGTARVCGPGPSRADLRDGQAITAQAGGVVQVANAGTGTLRLLSFAVSPEGRSTEPAANLPACS